MQISKTKIFSKFSFGIIISLILVLLLVACGDSSTPIPQTTTLAGGVTPVGTTVMQPKILRVATDLNGAKIEFTEKPTLNDGIPSFIWFLTEG